MEASNRMHMLCVDDEPAVLEGLSLHLRRRFEVATATSGAEGLAALKRDPSIAVVISDMRMPGMNGAEFLKAARQVNSDAVRMLLTGQADLASAISAVNDGRIFRFLSKPCPPAALMAAVDAATVQYRLVTAERVLLEQTLRGSIKTLVDVLALTNPAAFGRANRVKQLATDLAGRMAIAELWQIEVAALLSQLGYIILPAEVAEKTYYGRPLSEAEQKMVSRVPGVNEDLLRNIPRLELVREVLAHCARPPQSKVKAPVEIALQVANLAQVLRAALDFDLLETQGCSAAAAVQGMRNRPDSYSPAVLEALAAMAALRGGDDALAAVCDVPLAGLREGMIVAADVKMTNGTLLVARGYEITESFVERARNFRAGTVREPIRVIMQSAAKKAA